jgi:hypothetical protein
MKDDQEKVSLKQVDNLVNTGNTIPPKKIKTVKATPEEIAKTLRPNNETVEQSGSDGSSDIKRGCDSLIPNTGYGLGAGKGKKGRTR